MSPSLSPPDPTLLARHNVRFVASSHAPGTPAVWAAVTPPVSRSTWAGLALVAEHVPAPLAEKIEQRVRHGEGSAERADPEHGQAVTIALHVSTTCLASLIDFLRGNAEPPAAGLADAIEHAWRAYQAALGGREPTRIMGIVNVTPDSFNPVGRYADPGAAVEHGLRLVADGADVLDIGGESTRPEAAEVAAEEELTRVLPVVRRLARETEIPISVDTTKAEVAERCLEAGARWINDISGLTFDARLAQVVAQAGATLVLMHIRGTPRTMQQDPSYEDVVADTLRFLRGQLAIAQAAGIPEHALIIDPGFGFGKTVEHNLTLLRHLREYTSAGVPVLIGTSRKSSIGQVLGGLPSEERLEGTAATVAAAILNGAAIVRVHDVQAMHRVARMTDAIMGRVVG